MTALNKKIRRSVSSGFTLIELLIVMAILGVLAVVVLVAINPVQQLARTRDAGRKSGVTQIGHALEAYYTSHGGAYIDEGPSWLQDLVDAGEMSSVPPLIVNSLGTECSGNNSFGYCYDADPAIAGTVSVVFSALESDSELSKCGGAAAWFVWSTADGRGGLVCTAPTAITAMDWATVQ